MDVLQLSPLVSAESVALVDPGSDQGTDPGLSCQSTLSPGEEAFFEGRVRGVFNFVWKD